MTGYTKHKTARFISERRAFQLAEAMVYPVAFILLAYALCVVIA